MRYPEIVEGIISMVGFIFQNAFAALVFIYAGAIIVPRYKFRVSVILAFLFLLMIITEMIMLSLFLEGTAGAGINASYLAGLSILAAIYACVKVRKYEKRTA